MKLLRRILLALLALWCWATPPWRRLCCWAAGMRPAAMPR